MPITDPTVDGYDPMAVIADGLPANARGEEFDEDAMQVAGALVVGAQLIKAGMSYEAAYRQFEERDYRFRFAYDRADDSISIDIEWLDEAVAS